MAFASDNAIRQANSANRKNVWRPYKTGAAAATPQAAGQIVSLAALAGSPGAIADPSVYATCTDLAGAMINTNASPANSYLTSGWMTATQDGVLLVYDRLGHIGAVSLAATGNKTVASTALPRGMTADDLANVECWIELTTATTVTAPILSMNSYTNEAGTAGRAGATITFPAVATPTRWMAQLPLQAGDKGVQAVNTINVATAASAGVCNVILLRQIAAIPCTANVTIPSILIEELPRIYDGSSLCMMFLASAAAVVSVRGSLVFSRDA